VDSQLHFALTKYKTQSFVMKITASSVYNLKSSPPGENPSALLDHDLLLNNFSSSIDNRSSGLVISPDLVQFAESSQGETSSLAAYLAIRSLQPWPASFMSARTKASCTVQTALGYILYLISLHWGSGRLFSDPSLKIKFKSETKQFRA